MPVFADILADVESVRRVDSTKAAPSIHFELASVARNADVGADDERLRRVFAVYRATIDALESSTSIIRNRDAEIAEKRSPNAEFAALLSQQIAKARHSPEKLKSLRRRMAWMLHPDRTPSDVAAASQAMAHFNASIDAALAECSKR